MRQFSTFESNFLVVSVYSRVSNPHTEKEIEPAATQVEQLNP